MTDTKQINLTAKNFKSAIAQINEVAPELTNAVKGSKSDSYEYFLSSNGGTIIAHWNKRYQATDIPGKGKLVGSYLLFKTSQK